MRRLDALRLLGGRRRERWKGGEEKIFSSFRARRADGGRTGRHLLARCTLSVCVSVFRTASGCVSSLFVIAVLSKRTCESEIRPRRWNVCVCEFAYTRAVMKKACSTYLPYQNTFNVWIKELVQHFCVHSGHLRAWMSVIVLFQPLHRTQIVSLTLFCVNCLHCRSILRTLHDAFSLL